MTLMFDQIVDRLVSLVPLAALGYVLHRSTQDRQQLLEALERDQASARDRERELLNRITHPHAMPTGTRPAGPLERLQHREEAAQAIATVRAERQAQAAGRAAAFNPAVHAQNGLGRAFFPFPTDSDEV